jgi:hypothetical protein
VPAGLRACVNAAAAPQEEYRFELRLQGGDMEGSLLGLIMQGVPGVPQNPFAPRRGPLGFSPDRESAIGNVPVIVPGLLARLQDLPPLTELSPQVAARVAQPSLPGRRGDGWPEARAVRGRA